MAGKRTPATEVPPADRVEPVEVPVDQVENENRSSEIMVVLPAADEPVRRGGHILTDAGWVPEDLVPEAEED